MYTCAKNNKSNTWFDKVIAKIKWCSFLDSHGYVHRRNYKTVITDKKRK